MTDTQKASGLLAKAYVGHCPLTESELDWADAQRVGEENGFQALCRLAGIDTRPIKAERNWNKRGVIVAQAICDLRESKGL